MVRSLLLSALGLLVSSALVAAQVTTDCQPLNTTNCPPDPAFGMAYNFAFNQTPPSNTWVTTVGPVNYNAKDGASFTINKKKDSPTIRSAFYIFFGRVEVIMKAATGTGVISSVMLLSDDLDEIDWEFFGGNTTFAESNYFGKGQPDYKNAIYHPVQGAAVTDDYHNYTINWTQDFCDFYIDGQKVRTLLPKDANNTNNYPQTPMRISLGIWAGGDPDQPKGTREWAGGDTDYSKGPFTMFVKSTHVTDFHSGKEYSYGDMSGSWQSIKVVQGNSTAKESIFAPPPQSLADKWNSLTPTARTAIYASSAGVVTALAAYAIFYCIRQRRRGAREAKLAEQRALNERMELDQFKKAGIDPDSFVVNNTEYNPHEMRREGLADKDGYSVPSTPLDGVNEKTWSPFDGQQQQGLGPAPVLTAAAVAAAGANNGMRSPVGRVASPGPGGFNSAGYGRVPDRVGSPAVASPIRAGPPGMPPSFPPPASPAGNYGARSFSSPNPHMRAASPGPVMGGYQGITRTQSPAHMERERAPQRSFTGGPAGYGAGGRGMGGGGYEEMRGGGGGQSGYGGQRGGRVLAVMTPV